MSIQFLCSFLIGLDLGGGCFLFLLLSYVSSLYILDVNLLSNMTLWYIFLHSIGSFILLMVSLLCSFLFSCSPTYFSFCCQIQKKSLPQMMWRNLLLMLPSRSFFGFRPHIQVSIPFWVDFCVWCKIRGTSFFRMHLSGFPNTIYWRDCSSFPIVYSWLLCLQLIDQICMGLFLHSLICYNDLYVCFYANITLLWLL